MINTPTLQHAYALAAAIIEIDRHLTSGHASRRSIVDIALRLGLDTAPGPNTFRAGRDERTHWKGLSADLYDALMAMRHNATSRQNLRSMLFTEQGGVQ